MKSAVLNKPKFIFLSVKRNIIPFLFCAFTVCLVVFSSSNLAAAKSGLLLWANNVVPSLLPFFIATELLSHTNVINKIGKILNPIMKPIFNVPRLWSLCPYYGNN
jgi:nucleoside recognition membrane protein YjiH